MDLLNWVSKEEFWLPENVTWEIIKDWNYPNPYDLFYCIPFAIAFLISRLIMHWLLFAPIRLKIGFKRNKIQPNHVLETAFASGNFAENHIKELSSELNWTESKINRWFHKRRSVQKVSNKILESIWKGTMYTLLLVYGLTSLWDKPWFTDISESWTNFTTFITPNDIKNYFLVELGFYSSLMITQFVDERRKDFWQMLFHHVITILLIIFSWLGNVIRMGSLTMLCHDAADVPLEISKLFNYLKMKHCCNLTFGVFVIIWFVSRLIIFPFVILKSIFYNKNQVFGPVIYHICCGFLNFLMVLHLMWTWMIWKVIYNSRGRSQRKDVRSDSEESSEEDEKKME